MNQEKGYLLLEEQCLLRVLILIFIEACDG